MATHLQEENKYPPRFKGRVLHGESRIRTRGAVTPMAFRVPHHRPLGHLSANLNYISNAYLDCNFLFGIVSSAFSLWSCTISITPNGAAFSRSCRRRATSSCNKSILRSRSAISWFRNMVLSCDCTCTERAFSSFCTSLISTCVLFRLLFECEYLLEIIEGFI